MSRSHAARNASRVSAEMRMAYAVSQAALTYWTHRQRILKRLEVKVVKQPDQAATDALMAQYVTA